MARASARRAAIDLANGVLSTGEDDDEALEGVVKSEHEAPRSTPVVWGKTKALVFRLSENNPLSQWCLMDMLEPSAVPIEEALKDMAKERVILSPLRLCATEGCGGAIGESRGESAGDYSQTDYAP